MKQRIRLAAVAAACFLASAGAANGQRRGAPGLRVAGEESSATVEGAVIRRIPAYIVGAASAVARFPFG